MAKSTRRRKNYKLRKRVMRTVSALTMVMAVTVAAIPVERYGTMEAAKSSTVIISEEYEKFVTQLNNSSEAGKPGSLLLYDKAKEGENGYDGDDINLQKITEDGFESLFKAKQKDNDAIITGYNGGGGGVEVREKEYYDYVVFDNTYINKLNDLLEDNKSSSDKKEETYTMTFAIDTIGSEGSTVKKIKTGDSDVTYQGDNLTSKTIDNYSDDLKDVLSYTNAYKTIIAGDSNYVKNLLNSLGLYDQYIQDTVTAYNSEADDLIRRISEANGAVDEDDILKADIEAHNDKVGGTDVEKKIETKTYTYSELYELKGLQLVEFTILNRATDEKQTENLKGFTLAKFGEYNVPKKSDDESLSINITDGQKRRLDDSGYLAGGSVTIRGIASNAFDENHKGTGASPQSITSVTINNPKLEFIGASAFSGLNNLGSVNFADAGGCRIIGDRAFEDCGSLTTVTFGESTVVLTTIGTRAFKNTALNTIEFPKSVVKIGADSFASSRLTDIKFTGGNSQKIEIGKYAFYNCYRLQNGDYFDSDSEYKIMTGAFALDSEMGTSAVMTEFKFPANMPNIITGYEKEPQDSGNSENDYILAGRTRLETVTMPDNLAHEIPDNTFSGCENLLAVIFQENAGKASFIPELFNDVVNNDFHVEGPMYQGPSAPYGIAMPRQSTWNAKNHNGKYIPYKYMDENNDECWEYGIVDKNTSEAPYVASVSTTDEGGPTLMHVTKNPMAKDSAFEKRKELEIGTIGEKRIKKIASNVIDEDIRDMFYKITIQNDSVETIEEDAFRGLNYLEWVEIGNSVQSIGNNAFSECPWLENVVFNQIPFMNELDENSEEWTRLTIADDAFATGSDYLTFHGAVNPNYAPLIYAKRDNSHSLNGDKKQICYKSDAPTAIDYTTGDRQYDPYHLTAIRDNKSGDMTLIDYPHYEDVDLWNPELNKHFTSGITKAFEERYGIHSGTGNEETLYGNADSVVSQTIDLLISSGIDSVDTVKYFTTNRTDNEPNFDYFTASYYTKKEDEPAATEKDPSKGKYYEHSEERPSKINVTYGANKNTDVKRLYSDESYVELSGNDDEVSIPGLFSGYFVESNSASKTAEILGRSMTRDANTTGTVVGGQYGGHTFIENHFSGNDNLKSVNLGSVISLPNNAFYSCENLLSAKIGSALTNFGVLPFKDCKNLYSVDTQDNAKFTCDEGSLLLFENTESGGRNLIECFEGRGKGNEYSSSEISAAELAGTTSVSEGAFSNCTEIASVDFSSSSIAELPKNCFYKNPTLKEVKLPSTISIISEDSMTELTNPVDLYVPAKNCYINVNAFDGKTAVRIHGVKYENEEDETLSPCYKAFVELEKAHESGGEVNDEKGVFQFYDIGNTYVVEYVGHDLELLTDRNGDPATYPVHSHDAAPSQVDAPQRTGYRFDQWICRVGDKVLTGADTYTDVTEDRTIIATYVQDPSSVVPDGNEYQLTVVDGMALIGGNPVTTFPTAVNGGESIQVLANDQENFKVWTAVQVNEDGTTSDCSALLGNASVFSSSFTMPNANATVTANSAISSDDPNNPNNPDNPNNPNNPSNPDDGDDGDDNNNDDDNKTKYKLTVNYGSGSGEYEAGTSVTISAYAPESSSRVFSRWTSNNSSIGFASATSATTTLVMPAADATVTANYKARVDDDEDEDDDSSRRPNTNTTTTVTNPSGNSGNTTNTGSTVTNGNNGGSKIYITKNGISNKDLASVSVSGSTDNFIVRISETDEATAAAEEALINRYGSLDGLAYFPMDISLYDSTGQNKITDTYGLNINITMPIPDVLIQYGGNSRVAATDNGNLQALNPVKFTTIDGIACISFTPPHFSPYVIYVDTNNLTAGQTLDSTPSTGDPIHPKWFFAIGMACMSVVLFVASDGRKRKKYKTAW